MRRTWVAGIGALGKQIARNICYPSARRIGKTLYIPRGQIQDWVEEAEILKAKVTEHDLVAAFIYKVSNPVFHSANAKLNKLTQTIPCTGFFTSTYCPQLRPSHRHLKTTPVGGKSLQPLVHDAPTRSNSNKRIQHSFIGSTRNIHPACGSRGPAIRMHWRDRRPAQESEEKPHGAKIIR